MDENYLSHGHDETGIVPGILNAFLINRKQGKLIFFNVALTLCSKFAEQFPQCYSHKHSSASNDIKQRSSNSLS